MFEKLLQDKGIHHFEELQNIAIQILNAHIQGTDIPGQKGKTIAATKSVFANEIQLLGSLPLRDVINALYEVAFGNEEALIDVLITFMLDYNSSTNLISLSPQKIRTILFGPLFQRGSIMLIKYFTDLYHQGTLGKVSLIESGTLLFARLREDRNPSVFRELMMRMVQYNIEYLNSLEPILLNMKKLGAETEEIVALIVAILKVQPVKNLPGCVDAREGAEYAYNFTDVVLETLSRIYGDLTLAHKMHLGVSLKQYFLRNYVDVINSGETDGVGRRSDSFEKEDLLIKIEALIADREI